MDYLDHHKCPYTNGELRKVKVREGGMMPEAETEVMKEFR